MSGDLLALVNLVNSANPPAITSSSYGPCEADAATPNSTYYSTYQTGVMEGISIYVAAGDALASYCGSRNQQAVDGIGVNAAASTPYNVAVGGTDFADTYLGQTGTYWSASNTGTHSALSYIPEIPWNSSCGSQLAATDNGFNTTYGASGFCNSAAGEAGYYGRIWGGSGGPSGCAGGTPQYPDVVGGSCGGWIKPSWQSGFLGNPADGVRDLPDVSMFAAFLPWKHSYIICFSDPNNGGTSTPCSNNPNSWAYGYGGTSFGAPIWAGIQALINQTAGGRQGLPNVRLYQLAAKEYGVAGNAPCNSTNGASAPASCIFYDVTLGDNNGPCQVNTTYNIIAYCYRPSGTYGVLSTNVNALQTAYTATTGWDFSTGLGTVNVNNLVNAWLRRSIADTHDFNVDGKSDIFWRYASGDNAIWMMSGATIAGSKSLGNTATNWSVVGTRDFDGNGTPDLLWRDTAGDVWIWLMTNVPSIGGWSVVGNVPTNWSVVGTGDFNADGKGDILWHDTAGDLKIWFMNGFSISEVPITTIPTIWSVAGVGDFNGDGFSDIIWHDIYGDVSVWYMKGGTILQGQGFGNVPTNWSIVGTGDFDGNGLSDVLWRDTAGDVMIWLMGQNQNAVQSVLGNVGTQWSIAETGDFNGDGRSDILWLDTSGNVMIWFMNGFAAQVVNLGNFGTGFYVQGTNAD